MANDLGNLVSRTVAMIEKYYGGAVPAVGEETELEADLRAQFEALPAEVEKQMDALQFSQALTAIWKLVGGLNKYIDLTQPWILGKSEEGKNRLGTVLYYLAECVRAVAVLIYPVMPSTPARIFAQLGLTDESLQTWESIQSFGGLKPGTVVKKGEALFPRYDVKKELEALAGDKEQPAEKKEAKPDAKQPEKKAEPKEEGFGVITADDFFKVQLVTAKVTACERVPKSDKLLKETLDVGGETRTVLSGIAQWYTPEEMVGKTVVLVANLAPRKMRGIVSEGMLLCAADKDGNLKLVTVDGGEFASGAEIS